MFFSGVEANNADLELVEVFEVEVEVLADISSCTALYTRLVEG